MKVLQAKRLKDLERENGLINKGIDRQIAQRLT